MHRAEITSINFCVGIFDLGHIVVKLDYDTFYTNTVLMTFMEPEMTS